MGVGILEQGQELALGVEAGDVLVPTRAKDRIMPVLQSFPAVVTFSSPCSLGHRSVKEYSWEGESVCTPPAEHEEEVIPCWGLGQMDTDPRAALTPCSQGLHSWWFSWTLIQIQINVELNCWHLVRNILPCCCFCSSTRSPLLGKGSGIPGGSVPEPAEGSASGECCLWEGGIVSPQTFPGCGEREGAGPNPPSPAVPEPCGGEEEQGWESGKTPGISQELQHRNCSTSQRF